MIYWKLALKLYEQFVESTYKVPDTFGARDKIISEKSKAFISEKFFAEAGLSVKAREIIIMNARRWVTCPSSAVHVTTAPVGYGFPVQRTPAVFEDEDYFSARSPAPTTSAAFCKRCGWNQEGVLSKRLEYYTPFELRCARALKFD